MTGIPLLINPQLLVSIFQSVKSKMKDPTRHFPFLIHHICGSWGSKSCLRCLERVLEQKRLKMWAVDANLQNVQMVLCSISACVCSARPYSGSSKVYHS